MKTYLVKATLSLGIDISRSEIISVARQYYKTLRTAYRAQTTESGHAKQHQKNVAAYRRSRKKAVRFKFS